MEKKTIVVTGIARTPQGNMLGVLKDFSAHQLGTFAMESAIARSHIHPHDIEEVIMGCVLSAGQGQAPARQASLGAKIPESSPCTTINKMCGSGMQAAIFAYNSLLCGDHNIMLAGGMESMTNAPYLLLKGRQGYRLGHAEIIDHVMMDGLEDAYDKGRPMGYFAEQCAKAYDFTREQQDDYAISSLERAQKAIREKSYHDEITPITVRERIMDKIIDTDEHPLSVKIDKVRELRPIFMQNGTITAANSCSIADGAAALVLMTLAEAEKRGLKPLAKIVGHSDFAKAPNLFTTAPIDAIRRLLQKLNWSIDQIDLFEINEAFAVVTMAAMHDLKIPREKINIHGGGCALGHPIGATGARIMITLINALQKYQLKRGVAALCIGGGEATAIALERVI